METLIPQSLWDQGLQVAAENVAGGSSLSFLVLCVVLAAPLPFLLCLNQPQGLCLQEALLQLPVECYGQNTGFHTTLFSALPKETESTSRHFPHPFITG